MMKLTLSGLALSAALSLPMAQMCAAQIQPVTANSPQAADSPTPTPAPVFTMKPTTIQTGRTRDVVISVDRGDLKGYKLKPPIASSGVTYDPPEGQLTDNDTKLSFRVSIDEDADLGTVTVTIAKDKDAEPRTFDLEITEFRPRRISRGPTPDDITAVDAMWNVLPYKLTKANFGRRAADSFYAIEVFIGNNSGFDLQIVGVGFDTVLGARMTNKDGRPLEFLKDDKGKPIVDEYGNKFVEAIRKDGSYILNEKGEKTYRLLRKYQLATSDHRLVRGTIEKDQSYGSRALTMNLIGGFGTFLSGFIPFYRNANPKANFSTFSSIVNGQFKEGFGLSAPDLTVNQLNRLENLVLHEGLTVLNNTQARTIVFFPRHVVGVTEEDRKKFIEKGDMSPLLEKLGELIIVGKPFVSFNNREIVATKPQAATTQPTPTQTPAATAQLVTPQSNAPGQTFNISGSNLSGTSAATIGGVPARVTGVTNTQVTVEIPPNANSGDVLLTTPGGNVVAGKFIAQPRIEGLELPGGNGPGDTLRIKGRNLDTVNKVNFGGPEVKKGDAGWISESPTEVNVRIPPLAISGPITVKSPNGDHASTDKFTAKPVITEITSEAGAGEEVTIKGINLENIRAVRFKDRHTEEIVGTPGSKEVKVKVPSDATAAVVNGQITVTMKDGSDARSGPDKVFKLIEKPTVSGFSAVGGQSAQTGVSAAVGTKIEIHGSNLKMVKSVKFVGADAVTTDLVATNEKITVTVPAGAKTGVIKVTTQGGEFETTFQLTVP